MSKPRVKIKDWKIEAHRLTGVALNHPRFEPNTRVRTSTIIEEPFVPMDGETVETLNTIYELVGDGEK